MIDSPCIGVCEATDNLTCAGCHRTLKEIAAWPGLSDAEKVQVLAAIEERKAARTAQTPRSSNE